MGGAAEAVYHRLDLCALACRSPLDTEELGIWFGPGRADMRPAVWTQEHRVHMAAVSRLEISVRFLAGQFEPKRRRCPAELRTGERLAVLAVADRNFIEIDFCLVGHTTAMAATVNFHGRHGALSVFAHIPQIGPFGIQRVAWAGPSQQ